MYLQVLDFENKPFILGPYEVLYREFDPVGYYVRDISPVTLGTLLNQRKIRIILATTDGRQVIKAAPKLWSPSVEFFRNYSTSIVYPRIVSYKGKGYGADTRYILDIQWDGEREQVFHVTHHAWKYRLFKAFMLTEQSLDSKQSLKEFIEERLIENDIDYLEVKVFAVAERIHQMKHEQKFNQTEQALEFLGFWDYHVIGRGYSMIVNNSTRLRNFLHRIKRALGLADDQM